MRKAISTGKVLSQARECGSWSPQRANRFGAPVHDTQTTTERRNRSCQEVHGLVSWVGQEQFTSVQLSGLRDVSNRKAPGGGPVQEERRKTTVTVQWPPEEGREDDVQTTYGPWHVVRDDCYREEESRKSSRSTTLCHLASGFGSGWSGHVHTHYSYTQIVRHYVRPLPPRASTTRTKSGSTRSYQTNDCYCWKRTSRTNSPMCGVIIPEGRSYDNDDGTRTGYCKGHDCRSSNPHKNPDYEFNHKATSVTDLPAPPHKPD